MAHGKTTLAEAITGQLTLRHSEELKRGITIRLGYAYARIYKCKKCGKYCTSEKCPFCFSECDLQRTVSFVDAPGHETLMATVLTGAALIDGAILVIAANEPCPQPQTREHLKALELVGIKRLIVVQNKIDLVSEEQAIKNYEQIKEFIKDSFQAPIIPVSAQQKINIHAVLEAIEKFIPTVKRDLSKEPRMLVARSFDINKPGTKPKKLVGGVLGGAIIQGKLKLNDEIEIRPGIKIKEKYQPLFSKILGIQKAGINLEEAAPGGLLGLLTELDPYLTKSDALVGNVVGLPGKLPEPKKFFRLDVKLLERLVGLKELKEVPHLKKGEKILINVGTARSLATINSIKNNFLEMESKMPLIMEGEKVVISMQVAGRWRLIGYGTII